jgi:acetyl esterase
MPYAFDSELAPIVAVLPQLDLTNIGQARRMLLGMRDARPPVVLPSSVAVARRTIPGPADGPDLDVFVISAREPTATPVPAMLWIHGGGFVLGDAEGDLASPSRLAAELAIVVVSVEYRLAPEYPYPAGFEDCYAALTWMAGASVELGIDVDRLAVGGISAGAGLAAAVALAVRDRGGPALRLQLLETPVVDDRVESPSMQAFNDTPLWTRENAKLSWTAYLGEDRPDPVPAYAAPIRADDLSGLPPAFVVTCEFDPLRDEGIAYAQRLIAAGVPTDLHHYARTFHGSSGAGAGTRISARMIADRIDAVRRALLGEG